ncbi:unnamed protein product [Clonostachys solani]|uniref:Uncharacterized protein n=1 Tax=Clonostachys solani TaxID=160281 RepID=A0A9N9ZLM7_9HYPO|nr:unnamed protein product [Clonostachys solani]
MKYISSVLAFAAALAAAEPDTFKFANLFMNGPGNFTNPAGDREGAYFTLDEWTSRDIACNPAFKTIPTHRVWGDCLLFTREPGEGTVGTPYPLDFSIDEIIDEANIRVTLYHQEDGRKGSAIVPLICKSSSGTYHCDQDWTNELLITIS